MNRELFKIVDQPIDPDGLKKELLNAQSGALATFEGWVRDHNDGQLVERLEYSSYVDLANKEGLSIIEEAMDRFKIEAVLARHRTGLLEIGEIAVWVGACAAHREAAFDACRYIIEEIKSRVPIWKREYYSNGATDWVNCHLHLK